MCIIPPNKEIKVKQGLSRVITPKLSTVQNWTNLAGWGNAFDLPSSCVHDLKSMLGLERGHLRDSNNVKIQALNHH